MVKGMNRLELFAAQNRLSPFVSKDLLARIAAPIKFKVGNNTTHGFESDVLIDLAEAVIAADNAGVWRLVCRRNCMTWNGWPV